MKHVKHDTYKKIEEKYAIVYPKLIKQLLEPYFFHALFHHSFQIRVYYSNYLKIQFYIIR